MLQPPQQTHEAERVRGGEGGGEGEAVPPRQRPGPGQALHTLDMAAVKSPYILHVDVIPTSILSIILSGLRLPSFGSSTVIMTTWQGRESEVMLHVIM